MKIARLDNLAKLDSLFVGGEPDAHYEKRQIVLVEDNYDFAGNGATDISSITNFDKYGSSSLGLDFQQRMLYIKTICIIEGFSELSIEEKNLVGAYAAADDTELVTHYATTQTAGDVEAALDIHAQKVGDFVTEMNKVANARIESSSVKVAIMKYLAGRDQIDLFMSAIRNMVSDYKFKFHIGTQYGDSTDGILDYIENTGGYDGDGVGLDSYQFSDLYKGIWYATNAVDPQNPTQLEQDEAHEHVRDLLKTALVNILFYGIDG